MNKRPIRVLHLLNSVTGAGCGAVNAAIDIISGQVQQSLVVAVCSKRGESNEFSGLLDQNGIQHYALDQTRNLFNLAKATLALREIIKDFKPDIVHCHMMTGVILARAVRLTTPFGLVAHLHNVHQRSASLMGLADRVIAVSNAVKKDMSTRGIAVQKLRVVHNGPLGSLRFAQVKEAPPKDLLQPSIVSVCGLNHRKGVAELISAFNEVAKTRPEAHLYLVGMGPDHLEFRAQAEASEFAERIHFEGYQMDPIPYMKAATIFVLASRRDSFPLVLLEARRSGCPIIATNVDGIPEALGQGTAGVLVPPQDIPALSTAMGRLLDDPEERARLTRDGLANLDYFEVESMSAKITEVYEELLVPARPEGSSLAKPVSLSSSSQ
jgi:glycosyltransferase involved in cell wall biosynthesis